MITLINSAAARYDRALQLGHRKHLPPSYRTPLPTTHWPSENVALLEQYHQWLVGSGVSTAVIYTIYIPIAGHVLGYHLKPHATLDLDADLACALDYLKAKQVSAEWLSMNRCALTKFRRFLEQQRGQRRLVFTEPNLTRYQVSLPAWLVEMLTRFQHLQQANWRPARLADAIRRFWSKHARLWRWLVERHTLSELEQLKRRHLLDYIDQQLAAGYAAKSINQDIRALHAFLLFLRDQEWRVPQALLRLPALKEPDALPRFLTDQQVALLRDDREQRVLHPPLHVQPRDTLLDRATFYLMWQAGLRVGEVEELRLADLDLAGRKLLVRQAKGNKDRAVFLTDTTVTALQAYLSARGQGSSDHLFLYRAEPVLKDLIRARLKTCGQRVGVKVTPHQLRHTFATQLLNAGCKVTSIQRLLGHRRLNSTMLYARVHDQTVSDDYYRAMARIEAGLHAEPTSSSPTSAVQAQLRALVTQLDAPRLPRSTRTQIVAQMRNVLDESAAMPRGA